MVDKSLLTGSTTMLILKLLEDQDMYGYQMIEELSKKSCEVFNLKAGTLYPILHGLVNGDILSSYETVSDNLRKRKYYHLTKKGKALLKEKQKEWQTYTKAVNQVLDGGLDYAFV